MRIRVPTVEPSLANPLQASQPEAPAVRVAGGMSLGEWNGQWVRQTPLFCLTCQKMTEQAGSLIYFPGCQISATAIKEHENWVASFQRFCKLLLGWLDVKLVVSRCFLHDHGVFLILYTCELQKVKGVGTVNQTHIIPDES